MRKLSDHSPLIITVWGQHTAPNNPPRFFDTSLLSDEKSKKEMLEAWDGNRPPPSNDQDWPAWLEAAIGRVMHCNTRLARAKKRAQGTRVRTHAGEKKALLRELETESGTITGQNDLSQFIIDYYTHLYSSDMLTPSTAEAQA